MEETDKTKNDRQDLEREKKSGPNGKGLAPTSRPDPKTDAGGRPEGETGNGSPPEPAPGSVQPGAGTRKVKSTQPGFDNILQESGKSADVVKKNGGFKMTHPVIPGETKREREKRLSRERTKRYRLKKANVTETPVSDTANAAETPVNDTVNAAETPVNDTVNAAETVVNDTEATAKATEPEAKPSLPVIDPRLLTEILAGLLPFGLIVSLTGQRKFELKPEEKRLLSEYWDQVIEKYLPMLTSQYGAEYQLGIMIGFVLINKMIQPGSDENSNKKPAESQGITKPEILEEISEIPVPDNGQSKTNKIESSGLFNDIHDSESLFSKLG